MTAAQVAQFRALLRRDLLRKMVGVALCAPALPALALDGQAAAMDLMPAFWTAYDAVRTSPMVRRVDILIERFFALHATHYERAGVTWSTNSVSAWLPKFDAVEPGVRSLHGIFAERLVAARDAFRATLTDFDPILSPVTVLPSLFKFDAHLEPVAGQFPLFFGLDGIVRLHGADTHLAILMSHELFHCYQAQCNPALALKQRLSVCETLWMEGTATYASERLNRAEPLVRVLLDDQALAAMSPDTLRQVARSALAHFDADDDATIAQYFDIGYRGAWPARAGYHVGLLAARMIGDRMSLKEMASMDEAQFRPPMEKALAQLQQAGRLPA